MIESTCGFCAWRARAKRPVPIWVDAFLRDTMDLDADEIGAYHLILYAMWKDERCSLPDDPKRLARICRVSSRLWSSRISGALMRFFERENGVIFSRRLAREAGYIEQTVFNQHARKCQACKKSSTYALPEGMHEHPQKEREKTRKPLENNDTTLTADITADITAEEPTQQPNNPTYDDDDSAGAKGQTDRERLLSAMGCDPSGLTGSNGKIIGTPADMEAARRWGDDLGLSLDQQISVIQSVMAARSETRPPNAFKYFDQPMQVFASARSRPPLRPIDGKAKPNGTETIEAKRDRWRKMANE